MKHQSARAAALLWAQLCCLPPAMAACNDARPHPDAFYPVAVLHTSLGVIEIELDRDRAPIASDNFLRLVDAGVYGENLFHRVIKDFVVQTGGFKSDLSAVADCGQIFNESGNGLRNVRGAVAMARYSDPHSAQSGFYINVADNPSLDPNPKNWGYTVFGQVITGMDVVDRIAEAATGYHQTLDAKDVPLEPIVLHSVKVKND